VRPSIYAKICLAPLPPEDFWCWPVTSGFLNQPRIPRSFEVSSTHFEFAVSPLDCGSSMLQFVKGFVEGNCECEYSYFYIFIRFYIFLVWGFSGVIVRASAFHL
jgi:hypothetical protein